jgi:hypothetical protein
VVVETVSTSGITLPSQPGKVIVQDADRRLEFRGYLLHRVSTEVRHKPQWLEIELWKVTDGSGRYVLHFVGKSVLVHEEGSDCNAGIPTPTEMLASDAEPCWKCRPDIEHAKPGTVFEAETDRHKAEVCDGRLDDTGRTIEILPVESVIYLKNNGFTLNEDISVPITELSEMALWYLSARDVLRHLRESWRRRPEMSGTLSAPAQRLIDAAGVKDPAINAAAHVVEQLLWYSMSKLGSGREKGRKAPYG